jgi:AcrR family transcriptional regulator
MAAVKKKKSGESTEKRIVDAARKLFTEKGFHAIKTRDIAKEAGINLALLNYYFRSKEKLFELVVKENMTQFMQVIVEIVNDKKTSIDRKIEMLVANYIDMLSINPDVPLFIMNHMKHNVQQRIKLREKVIGSYFMEQIKADIKSGKIARIDPVNLMMNIVSLTIFPFVARNLLENNAGLSSEQFNALMIERKEMIPKWIGAMLKAK